MNPRKDPFVVLEIIQEAAELALSFVDGYALSDFLADRKTQSAVAMQLVCIGDEATRLMTSFPEFIARHPDLPLRQMIGMRNRVAHGNTLLRMDVVWETTTGDLPELLDHIAPLLRAAKTVSGLPTPTSDSDS